MKTNENSSRFAAQRIINANAKEQVTATAHSFIYYCKQLNKLAKKNEYCEATPVRDLGKSLLPLYRAGLNLPQGVYFHASLFTPDYLGRACSVRKVKEAPVTAADLAAAGSEIITDGSRRARQYILSADGTEVRILQPIALNLVAVCRAFAAVAATAARATDKQERAEAKERREREQEYKKRLRSLQTDYKQGAISGAVFRSEWGNLEQEYADIIAA